MTWFGWVLIVVLVINSVAIVAVIGEHRPTVTPGSALLVLAINVLLIWGAVTVGTVQP